MIPTVLAHAHTTLHLHPEAVAIAAVSFALSLAAWKVVSRIRRREAHRR
jgi:hypothetical protein